MKAAVFREYNKDPTQVIKIEDIDVPNLKPNEVLIKVEASAYNYNDLWAIWGEPIKTPLPHISGSDVAGTVVDVGSDVRKLKVGDRVASHSNMSCRVCDACTSGREYDCADRTIWGFQTGPLWGGFSQYTHLPEVNVVKIVDNVSFNDAAAVSMVGMTSWHMLVGRAKIKPGQLVLKMGGTLVATGATTGYDSTIDLRFLFFKGTNLLGSTQGNKAELEDVMYWVSKGKIKPVIDTVLPFSDMVKGHVMMAEAQQFGKILTTPQKL